MKKILLIVLWFNFIGVNAFTGEAFVNGVWYYIVTKAKTAEVMPTPDRYQVPKPSGDIIIPASIEYEGVTCVVSTIRDSAFEGGSITSVTISEGITTIGKSAFRSCSFLKTAVIPNSVTSMGNYAFSGCNRLESVNIPQNIDIINEKTFYNCELLKSIAIHSNITKIGKDAFFGCFRLVSVYISDLQAWCNINFVNEYSTPLNKKGALFLNGEEIINLVIPDNISTIKNYTFRNCTGITSVSLHEGITSIGKSAFDGCSSLTHFDLSPNITSIGESSFANCSSLNTLIIPQNIISIGGKAFQKCSNLESVSFSNKLNAISIGPLAFSECKNLNSVSIDDLKNWCHSSFAEGQNVYNGSIYLDFSSNPISIAKHLLINGTEIEELVIPNGVSSIGEGAFVGWDNLKSIIFSNNVTSIHQYAFYGCKSLPSLSIPSSVTSIGENAFSGCDELTTIYISDLSSWCNIDFDGRVFYNPLKGEPHLFLNGQEITNLSIPNDVKYIKKYAFFGNKSITSLTIPSSVLTIGDAAFANCNSLLTIIMGKGIVSIDTNAFFYCQEIMDVYCYNENVPLAASNTFNGSEIQYATLHVPTTSIDAYRAASPWSNFKSIIALTDTDPKPTGIIEVEIKSNSKDEIYNLNGRKVMQPSTGLYIKNGKKLVIK